MTSVPPTPPPGGSYTPPPPPPGGSYTPPPPPPPGGSAPGASSDRTLMVVLSYLGILALIPLLTKKDDRDIKWHAINGLGLAVGVLAVYIVLWILDIALGTMTGCLNAFIWPLYCILWVGYLAVAIMAMMKGIRGERMRFPVISDFADKNA